MAAEPVSPPPSGRGAQAGFREALLRAAAAGLKDSGGAGRVILNGTAGIFVEDTEELLASPAKDDFAVVNYHHYTGTIAPETAKLDINLGREAGSTVYSFTDHLRRINRVSHAAGKEAWLTEVGWDVTYGPAVGEELQTLYLPRAWVLARWCGTDKVFWFFDRDGQGKQKFSSCGLFDLEGNARPSAAATAALSQFTARARMAGAVDLGDDAWCILFQDAKRWVAVAWCLEGNRPAGEERRDRRAARRLAEGGAARPRVVCQGARGLRARGTPRLGARRLWVGGRIPARGIRSADPKKFWEHTCFEIFVDTGDAPSSKWGPTLHQFWISPVKEGGAWRASAGEWKRGEAIPASIFDDPRGRSALTVDGEGMSVEWLVPVAALGGKAPSPGTTWRAAVCVRSVADGEILDAAWPRPKSQGILDGSATWGVLRFSHE